MSVISNQLNLVKTTVSVSVHIIEARDLVGKDSNKLSDPFVRVTVAGQRKQTDIKHSTISCTWDQVFTFQDIVLTQDQLNHEDIHIECIDANTFFRNELIGRYTFNLAAVRAQENPDHQFYKKWIVLGNIDYPNEPQGYLLVSVTVIGPGDSPPAHLHDAESMLLSKTLRVGGEKRNLLAVPSVKRRGYNFSINIFRAEHLPPWDIGGSIDAFVVVKFNGQVIRTPAKKKNLTPDWNFNIVMPVYTPILSDHIDIQIWDENWASPDEFVAATRLKFSSLLVDAIPPTWFNFYGTPVEETSLAGRVTEMMSSGKIEPTAYLGRVLMSMSATLVQTPIYDTRVCPPVKGPTIIEYVLFVDVYSLIELPNPGIGGRIMVEIQFGPKENIRQSDWCTPELSRNGIDYSCQITCTDERYKAKDRDGDRGLCVFKECSVLLPQMERDAPATQAGQLYDLIVNIYSKSMMSGQTKIGQIRIKPKDVWDFDHLPEWNAIQGYANKNTGFRKSEGFILLGCSFVPRSQWEKTKRSRAQLRELGNINLAAPRMISDKPVMLSSAGNMSSIGSSSNNNNNNNNSSNKGILSGGGGGGGNNTNSVGKDILGGGGDEENQLQDDSLQGYQLRAYVYQGRNIASTDIGGLTSPYVTVSIAGFCAHLVCTQPGMYDKWAEEVNPDPTAENYGVLKRTSMVPNTKDPIWYETLVLPQIYLPRVLALSPDIDIRVFDGSEKYRSMDDYLGRALFPCELAKQEFWPPKARPRWIRLNRFDFSTQKSSANSFLDPTRWSEMDSSPTALAPGDYHCGEILIKLELIEISRRESTKKKIDSRGRLG